MKGRGLQAAAVLLGLACLAARGVEPTEATKVTGFRVPEYDDQGTLKSQLFGEFAQIYPNGVAEINEVKMEVYRQGEVDMRVTAPHCIYDPSGGRAGSKTGVKISRENMVVTGVGFRWEAKDETFQILSQVKVILKNARKKMETEGIQ